MGDLIEAETPVPTPWNKAVLMSTAWVFKNQG